MDAESPTSIWLNARIAADGSPDHVIEDGAIVVRGEKILWMGEQSALPKEFRTLRNRNDLGRNWITPGLVDCHTHLIHGGDRVDEFSERHPERKHFGRRPPVTNILPTVMATCNIEEDALLRQSARRLEALLAEGVTAIEIKSGYGLNIDSERKILRVARLLAAHYPVSIYTSFLGAHTLPPEFEKQPGDYIGQLCEQILPTLHDEGLIDTVDVMCGGIGFTLAHSERLLETAQKLNLPIRMQIGPGVISERTKLATRFRALSLDHITRLEEADVIDMKAAGIVAVLLPGTSFYLHEQRLPQIGLLRRHQVPIAIATDSNPESSPCSSLLLMLNMACNLFGLTINEALRGVTRNAAQALGKAGQHGTLAVGRKADFAIWEVDSLAELAYWTGLRRCSGVVRHGVHRDGSSFI